MRYKRKKNKDIYLSSMGKIFQSEDATSDGDLKQKIKKIAKKKLLVLKKLLKIKKLKAIFSKKKDLQTRTKVKEELVYYLY